MGFTHAFQFSLEQKDRNWVSQRILHRSMYSSYITQSKWQWKCSNITNVD